MASTPEPMDHALHLKLTSTFDNLERAVEEAEAFMAGITDDEDLAYNVVLLTSEAVTNGMEHGNGWDASKHIIFDLTANKERIELSVLDEGEGFDPASIGNPLDAENLLNGRGRGLYFMEEIANELHIEDDGCRLRLIFYRSP